MLFLDELLFYVLRIVLSQCSYWFRDSFRCCAGQLGVLLSGAFCAYSLAVLSQASSTKGGVTRRVEHMEQRYSFWDVRLVSMAEHLIRAMVQQM